LGAAEDGIEEYYHSLRISRPGKLMHYDGVWFPLFRSCIHTLRNKAWSSISLYPKSVGTQLMYYGIVKPLPIMLGKAPGKPLSAT
jgi:hypothetical protein